jgi:galactitol-specific phosphotransferase system IIB component
MDKIRIACGNRGVGTSPLFAAVEGGYMKEHDQEPVAQLHREGFSGLVAS